MKPVVIKTKKKFGLSSLGIILSSFCISLFFLKPTKKQTNKKKYTNTCAGLLSLYTANMDSYYFVLYITINAHSSMLVVIGIVKKAHSWEALPPKASIKNSTN